MCGAMGTHQNLQQKLLAPLFNTRYCMCFEAGMFVEARLAQCAHLLYTEGPLDAHGEHSQHSKQAPGTCHPCFS